MLNGWFLVPDLLYGHDTVIAATSKRVTALFFDSFPLLLNPLRAVPAASTTPALFVQIPVWMLLWALVVGGAAVTSSRFRSLRRPFLVLIVMFGFVLGLITIPGVWRSIPGPWLYVQFPYRLNSYLALIVSALVGVAVLVAQRMPTAAPDTGRLLRLVVRASLGAVCAMSLALCAWQLWIPRTLAYPTISGSLHVTGYANRYDAMASIYTVPTSWYAAIDYANTSGPIIAVSPGRELTIDPETIDNHGDSVTTVVQAPPGSGPIGTNIAAGPYLVTIGGDVVRVGTSPDGFAVVQRREPGTGPVLITVNTAESLGVVAGRVSSTVGALLIVGLALYHASAARNTRTLRRADRLRP